ncbi:hypothetical protein PF010_g14228 [Phytophthora fragariae]|uniref:Uncharacterized protein n=1 Tax=Phytophthora fragariae TaxID=53985 RepID=A0A6A3T8R3_9STRA|nr:hypothetical protein PF003_g11898 [Phytophthora fragariae]KAE8932338.1 hypothetical protein PF009_g17621 [Phytophthora fragariae]KAE9097083.1 hypothetical protein PF007_g16743 [Phytophthora fragariae]KAE9102111.1 hypothetical protein PF010_g14228 [Phytophthora fragariae]KAE9131685.1 hypothetical protein PF006_g15444 [Phytophthora fragariae]
MGTKATASVQIFFNTSATSRSRTVSRHPTRRPTPRLVHLPTLPRAEPDEPKADTELADEDVDPLLDVPSGLFEVVDADSVDEAPELRVAGRRRRTPRAHEPAGVRQGPLHADAVLQPQEVGRHQPLGRHATEQQRSMRAHGRGEDARKIGDWTKLETGEQ